MSAGFVDLVLVVDASESMAPCFKQLTNHLADLLLPLRQADFKVRFGLVAYSAGKSGSQKVYDHTFVGGSGAALLAGVYANQPKAEHYFTSQSSAVLDVLKRLRPQGNEHTLLALDVAADLPFGNMKTTRRVIAVFTDERLEDGIDGDTPNRVLPELVQKLMQRRIQLFVAAPFSDALEVLGSTDNAQIEAVSEGDGLRSLDFSRLMAQMGKSISMMSLQSDIEQPYRKALFGQNGWGAERTVTESNRQVVLAVGESSRLDVAATGVAVRVTLSWTAAVDLDLHAFCRTAGGDAKWVYFANRSEKEISLDTDAGIGDVAGKNREVIELASAGAFDRVLFATKIFRKGGCFADYDGTVTVQAEGARDIVVPLTATRRADWCVIAAIKNEGGQGTMVHNVNQVVDETPQLYAF